MQPEALEIRCGDCASVLPLIDGGVGGCAPAELLREGRVAAADSKQNLTNQQRTKQRRGRRDPRGLDLLLEALASKGTERKGPSAFPTRLLDPWLAFPGDPRPSKPPERKGTRPELDAGGVVDISTFGHQYLACFPTRLTPDDAHASLARALRLPRRRQNITAFESHPFCPASKNFPRFTSSRRRYDSHQLEPAWTGRALRRDATASALRTSSTSETHTHCAAKPYFTRTKT